MASALSYGLMGAAQGFLTGLHQQWQQDQEDIRTQKLRDAKMQEERSLAAMKAQYDSAANYEKTMLDFQTKSKLQDEDAANKAALQASKDEAEAKQKALDRASEEKRTSMSAGATLGAARLRADTDSAQRPRGDQMWQLPDGTNVLVKPDENPPKKGQLIWANGGSIGARQRGNATAPVSTLGLMGAVTSDGSDDADADVTATPAPVPAAPVQTRPAAPAGFTAQNPVLTGGVGSSPDRPAAATSFSAPPPPGTWVRLPSGRVTQIPGA